MVEVICPECLHSFKHDSSKIAESISLIYCPQCKKPMILRIPSEQLPVIQARGGTIEAEQVKTYNSLHDPEGCDLGPTLGLQSPF